MCGGCKRCGYGRDRQADDGLSIDLHADPVDRLNQIIDLLVDTRIELLAVEQSERRNQQHEPYDDEDKRWP